MQCLSERVKLSAPTPHLQKAALPQFFLALKFVVVYLLEAVQAKESKLGKSMPFWKMSHVLSVSLLILVLAQALEFEQIESLVCLLLE